MDFCKLDGKFRFADEIIEGKSINYKVKKEFKVASSNGGLKCPDCGEGVIFKGRNIEIKAPHFSHKCKTSCKFGENRDTDWERYGESLQHLRVKKIFTQYFRHNYKDAFISEEFQLDGRKRIADVYVKFKNDMEIAIEYQHSEINYDDWALREEFYQRNNIKSLWIIDSDLIEKVEYKNTNFIGQILANEKNKMVLGINPIKKELIIAKLISIKDEDGELKEWFYKEKCNLDELTIKETGVITNTTFNINYNFYLSKERDKVEKVKKNKYIETKVEWTSKIYNDSRNKESIYKNKYIELSKTNYYFNQILGAIKGNQKAKSIIIEFIADKAGFDDFKIIESIFEYFEIKSQSRGVSIYDNARNVYLDIMKETGSPVRDFSKENVLRFKCPYCENNLKRDRDKYGNIVKCSNDESCKFSFKC